MGQVKIDEMQKAKINEAMKKALEEYEEMLRKTKMVLSSDNSENIVAATNQVNDAAYQVYLKTLDQNDEKSEQAYQSYQKTLKTLDEETDAAYGQYQKTGQPSYEEYLDIKQKNDKARDEAYDLYSQSKEENDNDSSKAYDGYLQQYEKNIAASDKALNRDSTKQMDMSRFPNSTTIDQTLKTMNSAAKDLTARSPAAEPAPLQEEEEVRVTNTVR